MTVKFLLPLVLVSALALTACGKNDADTTPAAAATPAPVTAPAETPAAVAPAETPAMAPAPTAAPTPEEAMKAIQAQAAQMTDAQKQETIAAARKAAEDAGKAQGLTDDQIKQAADMAETATKQMLGVQ